MVVALARRGENDVEKHGRVEPHHHDETALNRHTVVLVARRADAKFDEHPLLRTVSDEIARRAAATQRTCATPGLTATTAMFYEYE